MKSILPPKEGRKFFERPCGCVIDVDETGSGITLCPKHQKEAAKHKTAEDVQKFLDEMMTP